MERFSRTQLEQRTKELLSNKLSVPFDEVDLSSDFAEDLCADSLDVVESVMLMEVELGILISDAESEKVYTVKDLFEICFQKLYEQGRIQD